MQLCFPRGSSERLSPHPDPCDMEAPTGDTEGASLCTEGLLSQAFHVDAKCHRGEGLASHEGPLWAGSLRSPDPQSLHEAC